MHLIIRDNFNIM